MNDTLNVLHLQKRTDREQHLMEQMEQQGITYNIVDGIDNPQIPFLAISQGFKRIVRDARERGLGRVIIAEDDIRFFGAGAWDYYLDKMPEDFDLYLGMIYEGSIKNNLIVSGFSGLTLFTVSQRFYDRFLSMNELNNADRELGNSCWKHKYVVCDPFVCEQIDGYSNNKHKHAEYGYLLKGRRLFGGNV